MRRLSTPVPVALVLLAIAPACGPAGNGPHPDGGTGPDGAPGNAPTYYQDIRPVLQSRCVSCHHAGGIGPFALDSVDAATSRAPLLAHVTAERTMPPFPPDTRDCAQLDDPRILPQAEIDLINAWSAAGAPAGDAAHPAPDPAPPASALGAPSQSWAMDTPHQPPASGDPDEYRCYVIDPHVTTYLPFNAVYPAPGNLAIAHHAVVYLVLPNDVSAVRALDARDERPGYPCVGGAGVQNAPALGLWVPGMIERPYPDGTGSYIPPGSVFVLEMHYNYANARTPDTTRIQLWSPALPPTRIPTGFLVGNFDFAIPPGARDYTATGTARVTTDAQPTPTFGVAPVGRLWQVWAHQHLRGRALRMDLVHADGRTECLLDIPQWNFHWQSIYNLVHPIDLVAGDEIRLSCHWDNTDANQPVINGVAETPRLVTFGEGTGDEMCIGSGVMTSP